MSIDKLNESAEQTQYKSRTQIACRPSKERQARWHIVLFIAMVLSLA
jgi:hypothetical protein